MSVNNLGWLVSEEDEKRIQSFSLMDDDFFSEVFDGDTDALEYLLNVILQRNDIEVIDVKTQVEYHSAGRRSITLDVRAIDKTGKIYDVEVQRSEGGASPRRGRVHSSMIDRTLLKKGQDFDEIADAYVIFITEFDKYELGKPMYHVERRVEEKDLEPYGDGSYIIYVNGEFRDTEHPIGKLMHDFNCTKADDMLIPVLAKGVRYYKETEGGRAKLCKKMEDMRNESAVKATIVAYDEVGIKDEAEIITRLQKRFQFVTPETVKRYMGQLRESAVIR